MLAHYTYPVFNLPSGPKNLKALMPALDFTNVASYYVELRDDQNAIILRTPQIAMGCCCSTEKVRIHFLNALGKFDAVNFLPPYVVHESTSGEYRRSLPKIFVKTDAAIVRFNVRSNETYECLNTCYHENEMPWLMELVDSGRAFLEWKGTQGQSDAYLPVRILDGKYEKKKNNEEWIYQFKLTFKMANENILQR